MRQRDIKLIIDLMFLPFRLLWVAAEISLKILVLVYGFCQSAYLSIASNGRGKVKYHPLKNEHQGWVYILSNRSLEQGILKIGMTTRYDHQIRVDELNRATGIPTNFKTEYIHSCSAPYQLEQVLHEIFKDHRVSKNRAFFKVTVSEVKEAIKKLEGK